MIVLGFSGITKGDWYQKRYGLRFVGHDSSVALLRDGKVLFALEEERLSRHKHTSELPVLATRAALLSCGIELGEVDLAAYPWNATAGRVFRMLWHHPSRIPLSSWPDLALAGGRVIHDLMRPAPAVRRFGKVLGKPFRAGVGIPHHLGHSACAYFTSPFEQAAVLTVDGQGEDQSASLGEWQGTAYRPLQRISSPDSIGILYGMLTDFLGMRAGWDEYKVMAMAAKGDAARFAKAFEYLVQLAPAGRYRTRGTALVFRPGYTNTLLSRLLCIPPRLHGEAFKPVHFDIAAALQARTEAVLFHLLKRLRELSASSNLCLAGGVFLNSVANGKIQASELFKQVHIPPVPGDHGGALGAALAAHQLAFGGPRQEIGFSPFCGPAYDRQQIERALQEQGAGLEISEPRDLVQRIAKLLARDVILGWFRGRAEYGPRALGHRSILASPLRAATRARINAIIKHREAFRPFGGAVPIEAAGELFELARPSAFMQFVVPVRAKAISRIPALVHEGSCRVQTVDRREDPIFHALLRAFEQLSGVPVLLNTSFNDADEPIVCSPQDAVRTFRRCGLEALILGPFLCTPEEAGKRGR